MAATQIEKPKKKNNGWRNKVNLFLDSALVLIFIVEMEEHFTGQSLHELIGLLFGAIIIVHLILHFDWIVSITRNLFKNLIHESRLNYLLNWILFFDMITLVITGIFISKTLGLNFGFENEFSRSLQSIHIFSAQFVLVLLGLHVAMHWKWIVTHARKYIFHLPNFRRNTQPTPVVTTSANVEA